MRVRLLLIVASTVLLAPGLIGARPAPAGAGEPPPITSSTECFMVPDPRGGISTQLPSRGTISPAGGVASEDIHVKVTVRNVLGAPMSDASVTVTATSTGGAAFVWDSGQMPPGDTPETPQTGLSDAGGVVEVVFDEGGVSLQSTPTLPDLNFDVLIDEPGPGTPYYGSPCNPALSVLGYDLNADGRVNLTDFGIFSQDYGAGNPRSDFNWSGTVDLTDFGAFAANYGASLDAQ